MNDRPTAAELLEAVEHFLESDVVPALEGPARYHARVAASAVRIVAREIECADAHLAGEWERTGALLEDAAPAPGDREALQAALLARGAELSRRIRVGDADPPGPWRAALWRHLDRTVADKLDVSRPPRREPRP